jgi:hypothetical protein
MGKILVILKMDNMNLQENINRIQQMMGIINEDSNMEKMIFDIINEAVEGVDLYEDKGSLWLIFTDNKEWVIKLNKKGVLWYNYYFFNIIFRYLSLDVVENQHYITKWVEDTIKNEVKFTLFTNKMDTFTVEDTIKNGVKHTEPTWEKGLEMVQDIIKNRENLGNIKNG